MKQEWTRTKRKTVGKSGPDILEVAAAYLEEHGWKVIMIGGTGVIKRNPLKEFGFSLVIDFTGKKITSALQKNEGYGRATKLPETWRH